MSCLTSLTLQQALLRVHLCWEELESLIGEEIQAGIYGFWIISDAPPTGDLLQRFVNAKRRAIGAV